MFSAPEVSSEFSLLSDFLGNWYSEDIFTGEQNQSVFSDPPPSVQLSQSDANNTTFNQQRLLPPANPNTASAIPRPGSVKPSAERARENYYLTAADPSQAAPEERMKQVLKAKLEAGLLKPFNYVKGYARLSRYMDENMAPGSRRRILSQLDKFRPKFRERTHQLTDLDLVRVEEWFEKSLLEYDRVFASMAVPACLWRRTGEIFRGNKEFAELINVPIEQMRDVGTLSQALEGKGLLTFPISSSGKVSHIRAGCGRFCSQLLGKVRHHCLRYFTKGHVDKLSPKKPRSKRQGRAYTLLLLIHYSARHE
jgi:hypothetical protein